MKKFLMFLCAVVLVIGIVGTASALTMSAVDGAWTGTTGGYGVNYYTVSTTYGNGSEDQVRWGNPASSDGQSGLGFTGIAPPPVTFNIGDAFEIGQLRHFNNPIGSGSEASEAFLTITMDFTDPVLSGAFDFTFEIDETPNNVGTGDDFITFPSAYAAETFDINNVNYTLRLLGFGNDANSLVDSFSSPEGGTNATKLWGEITTPANPVPEPSTILLMGIGLLGLVGYSRKRKKS